MYANGNVTQVIGDKLWVPWYGTSSSCTVNDLKSGSSCNSGETIDMSHNCMVTDEFSQVGILVAMGQNQQRMDQFFNTVNAIPSTSGQIPAWRVYRSGTSIEPCRSGINGNCDTASDATARIIIALFAASNNSYFANQAQKTRYHELAKNLSAQMVAYETLYSCKPSSLGHGQICYWLAAGAGAKSGGFASTDFAYTGYYPDAIIAMLQACAQTGNATYCAVAGNFTLNYLEASKWTGQSFRVPPGRSFKWVNTSGIPAPSCTNTCNPDQWDGADAPRALGMCQANYYAARVGITLPGLQSYCTQWGNLYMNNPNSAPYQYYADGQNSVSSQSGYFAQGMQALFQSGGHNAALFAPTLDNALSRYSTSRRTFDNQACFGVYTQAFAIRALGFGIGRDEASFPLFAAATVAPPASPPPAPSSISISTSPDSSSTIAETDSQVFSYTLSNPSSQSTTTTWYLNGVAQQATGSTFTFVGNSSAAGTYTIMVRVAATMNTVTNNWTLSVIDTPVPVPVYTPISFASTSPGSPLAAIVSTPQAFTFSLSNPSGQPVATTWYLNGDLQGTTGSSYTVNTPLAGTYQVSVRVAGVTNTLTNNWTYIVLAQTTNSSTENASSDTNASNGGSNSTNVTISPPTTAVVEQILSPTVESSGGGGGNDDVQTFGTPGGASATRDLRVRGAIISYFTGELPATELVDQLRTYYDDGVK